MLAFHFTHSSMTMNVDECQTFVVIIGVDMGKSVVGCAKEDQQLTEAA
jgi:hypothetical protein